MSFFRGKLSFLLSPWPPDCPLGCGKLPFELLGDSGSDGELELEVPRVFDDDIFQDDVRVLAFLWIKSIIFSADSFLLLGSVPPDVSTGLTSFVSAEFILASFMLTGMLTLFVSHSSPS